MTDSSTTTLPSSQDHDHQGPRLLVLGAAYGTGNMGVDALLSGTIASAFQAKSDCEIALLDYGHQPAEFTIPGPRGDKRKVELINLRFSWRLHLRNNGFRLLVQAAFLKLIPSQGFRNRCIRKNQWLSAIEGTDCAVALAGGDSFSDIYGMRRLLYVCLPQFLVALLGVRLVMLPQTIGPFKSKSARVMSKRAMDACQQVYARDATSLELAKKMVSKSRPEPLFSQDMAFALVPREPESGIPELDRWQGSDKPLVGINISGLLLKGGYTQDNMFGLKGDYPALVKSLVSHFVTELDCRVILVSHVTGKGENDVEACQEVGRELSGKLPKGSFAVASGEYDHREVKSLIGNCDFFLGSRMHACIAALSQAIPAVGLAYSRKFLGVYETIEADELVVDLRSLSNEEVLAQVEELFQRRKELTSRIKQPVATAKKAAEGLLTRYLVPKKS